MAVTFTSQYMNDLTRYRLPRGFGQTMRIPRLSMNANGEPVTETKEHKLQQYGQAIRLSAELLRDPNALIHVWEKLFSDFAEHFAPHVQDVSFYVKQFGSAGTVDPLDQYATIAWKATSCEAFNPQPQEEPGHTWRANLRRGCQYRTCLLQHVRDGINTGLSAKLIITG